MSSAIGTLTETNDVGSEDEYWQGRIVDPTGTVFVYAGQYQPDAAALLRKLDPPEFVAVVGKPRTYETDDGETNVSLRPENLTVVDGATRDRWVAETAHQTLDRLDAFNGATEEFSQLAREEYGKTVDPYRQAVIEALESLEDVTDQQPAAAGTDNAESPTGESSTTSSSRTNTPSHETETETSEEESREEFESSELGSGSDPQS